MKLLLAAFALLLAGCATGERYHVLDDEEVMACSAVVKPPCVMGARIPDEFWATRRNTLGFKGLR